MQSTAQDVDTYLREVPAERLPAIEHLRALCQATLPGYDERMNYGMPTYELNGVGEIAFASQKHYIALYILKKEIVDAHRPQLQGLNVGKGCIRYTTPAKMDFNVIESLLHATVNSSEKPC
ncbi:MAG: DUF1801 domain-containing protein [Roseiflexaceae bacterium]|nr:DUF1801 domain-containing protein [Roseiflexaceae bacterium]